MRRDCRHYESRTYASGEIVQRCRLDLAPEAPWRCPDDCPGFSKRMIDVGWQYGSMATPATRAESRSEPEGEDIAALLDELQYVVNSAAPDVVADHEQSQRKGLFKRRKASKRKKPKGKRKKKGR